MGVLKVHEQAGSGRLGVLEARMQAREAHEQAGGGRPRGARDRS